MTFVKLTNVNLFNNSNYRQMKLLQYKSFALLLLLFVINPFYAQKTYEANKEKSKVIIEGTSNIHDWEMYAETLTSSLELASNSLEDIAAIAFEVPVKGLKSGKNKMDKNTYEALKEKDHAKIQFKSSLIEFENGRHYANGDLTIAGITKQVKIPFEITKDNNNLILQLAYEINMLDYNVEPPTAMFGTIRTGDKVTTKINLIYQ